MEPATRTWGGAFAAYWWRALASPWWMRIEGRIDAIALVAEREWGDRAFYLTVTCWGSRWLNNGGAKAACNGSEACTSQALAGTCETMSLLTLNCCATRQVTGDLRQAMKDVSLVHNTGLFWKILDAYLHYNGV